MTAKVAVGLSTHSRTNLRLPLRAYFNHNPPEFGLTRHYLVAFLVAVVANLVAELAEDEYGIRSLEVNMPQFPICVIAVMVVAWTGTVFGQNIPAGYTIPTETLSPDDRYGVTVPKMEYYKTLKDPKNEVVEIATGHVLGAIQGDVAFDGMNHVEIVSPFWSADDSMLLWQVDGKWGFNTEVLIKLDNEKIKCQVDVLKLLQQEILKRTRKAVPEKYAAVKAKSGGDGSWYKDGFAIDCVLVSQGDTLKFPLLARVFLTSNPKSIEGDITVDSRMTAKVNRDGTIKVDDFHLGNDPPARNFILPSQLPK